MSKKLRESFVEHPRAILFLRISGEGVFQHPCLISSAIPQPRTISLAFETNWHTILRDETRMSGRLQMTNNRALTLALVMAGLAAACYRFGDTGKGVAIVAIMAACVFAVWPMRLKRGLVGREQWRQIRLKGRTHFVITHGVAFCGVLAVWTIATDYVADSHLPKYWAWQLFALLCGGCLGGLWEWRSCERKYSE